MLAWFAFVYAVAVIVIFAGYFILGPAAEGTVEFRDEAFIYQNNLYTGYIDYSVATGVELKKKWSGKKLVIYGAPDIDFVERHGRWGYYLPGLRMNRYEGELCVYPSRNFDIEEVERELVRRGVPRMQTLKLPRQR